MSSTTFIMSYCVLKLWINRIDQLCNSSKSFHGHKMSDTPQSANRCEKGTSKRKVPLGSVCLGFNWAFSCWTLWKNQKSLISSPRIQFLLLVARTPFVFTSRRLRFRRFEAVTCICHVCGRSLAPWCDGCDRSAEHCDADVGNEGMTPQGMTFRLDPPSDPFMSFLSTAKHQVVIHCSRLFQTKNKRKSWRCSPVRVKPSASNAKDWPPRRQHLTTDQSN